MRSIVLAGLVPFLLMISGIVPAQCHAADYKKWEVVEISIKAEKNYAQPYLLVPANNDDGLVEVTFKGVDGKAKGESYTVNGFWDGGTTWKVRFAPPYTGKWIYSSQSKDSGLDGHEGSFTVSGWKEGKKKENPVRRGFIEVSKKDPRSGRHFQYSDGTPFLWIGDTWWNWTKEDIHFSSFKRLVDDRVKKGFTLGQLFVPGNGWSRKSSITNEDYTGLDMAHMQKVDSMIRYANKQGLTVWIHGWWSRENLKEKVGAENIKRWWRYLVNRFAAYNVIWVLAGEYNMHNYGGFKLSFWKNLGSMIEEIDPYNRIISTHTTPPGWGGGADAPQWSTGKVLHEQSWLDYNQSQTGHGRWRNRMIPQVVEKDYARIPPKPVVVTEPWYEFKKDTPKAYNIRYGAWTAILSGAAGHSYGGGHIWRAHLPESPAGGGTWPLEKSFDTHTLNYPGAVSISHMAKFLKKIPWWKFEPRPELVSEYPDPYCSVIPGEKYLVYIPWGGSVKVNLKHVSMNEDLYYHWINPASWKTEEEGTVSGGSVRLLSSPAQFPGNLQYQDWVLYISKE